MSRPSLDTAKGLFITDARKVHQWRLRMIAVLGKKILMMSGGSIISTLATVRCNVIITWSAPGSASSQTRWSILATAQSPAAIASSAVTVSFMIISLSVSGWCFCWISALDLVQTELCFFLWSLCRNVFLLFEWRRWVLYFDTFWCLGLGLWLLKSNKSSFNR